MDVRLTDPDLQAKLDRWVTETGRDPDELVEDAMAGYFDELARTREMLKAAMTISKVAGLNPFPVTSLSKSAASYTDRLNGHL